MQCKLKAPIDLQVCTMDGLWVMPEALTESNPAAGAAVASSCRGQRCDGTRALQRRVWGPKCGTTRIRTPGFPHAKRTRYHCVTVPNDVF